MANTIIELIQVYGPTLVAFITEVVLVIKMCGAFNQHKQECLDLKDVSVLRAEMKQILHENAELKKLLIAQKQKELLVEDLNGEKSDNTQI